MLKCIHFTSAEALQANQDIEFERNKERFNFLKWGAKAFKNMLIVPPGSGIVHQVSVRLSRVTLVVVTRILPVLHDLGETSHSAVITIYSQFTLCKEAIFVCVEKRFYYEGLAVLLESV